MIPPIPKRQLIHSAELITDFSPDKWGKPSESETVQLEHVRIEPSAKRVINGSGETVQLAAALFFDCRNSFPADVMFALKDDTMNGRTVVLQKVSFGGGFLRCRPLKLCMQTETAYIITRWDWYERYF